MKFIIDFIKGIFVGVANVIPGVSGGTMAVTFGIYDRMLTAIANIFKDFKKSFKSLLPIGLGMGFGVIAFTFIIPWLLKNEPFITAMAFTGLIIGGIPMMLSSLKNASKTDVHVKKYICFILFLLFFAITIGMLFLNGDEESGVLLHANPQTLIVVFFMGVIASATMIIPGVSGSLVLMVLGFYFGILSAVKDFIAALKHMDIDALIEQGLILLPFGIGCLLGIIFISKLISWLFEHFPVMTYSSIMGLIFASPVSIFYKVNQEYSLTSTKLIQIIIGIVIFILCTGVTLYISKKDAEAAN